MQESNLPTQPPVTPNQPITPTTPVDQPTPQSDQPVTPPTQSSEPVTYTVPHHAGHKVLFILLGIITLALLASGLFALFSSSIFQSKIIPSPTVDYTVDDPVSNPATNSAQTTRPFELAPTLSATDSALLNPLEGIDDAVGSSPGRFSYSQPSEWPTKETLCYSFRYAPGGTIGDDNSCDQYLSGRLSTDPTYPLSMSINAVYNSNLNPINSAEDMITNRAFDTSYQVSQDPNDTIWIDGVAAVKVVETPPLVNIENHRYFIYLPDQYENRGMPIVGFEIFAVISKVEPEAVWQQQKIDLQAMLESWQWQ